MKFTAKEKAAIDKAYQQLEYVASYSLGGCDELHGALKYEKESRGLTRAKAILVENTVKAIGQFQRGEELTASELFGFAKGCAYARMLGGDVARRVEAYTSREGDYGRSFVAGVSSLIGLADACEAAFDQARERALAELSQLPLGAS